MHNPTTIHNHPSIAEMPDPSPVAIRIDGSEQDAALSKSEFLTQQEVFERRKRRLKQLERIYRHQYWLLFEELKLKYREYYWQYGKSPFVEENEENQRINSDNDSTGRCGVNGCKAKAMVLTDFCHMHILSDTKQTLYKPCNFNIKSISSTTGPILCGKPILRSTVPSFCPPHIQKAERHLVRTLKKSGLNITSTSKLAPKVHVIMMEYIRIIQQKRKATKRKLENAEIKVENNP
ncbi:INO80 complex subunit D-like isoform X2 [Salvia hispanica]|uniref:INO80 complex subunit D-like isoform X2 n=1 Tax=Salvia hispanica TaxID=49212 RepID=UPI0020092AAC|nr:INO80 complex subunit D-like isoform X2 [Salvia hispanica]